MLLHTNQTGDVFWPVWIFKWYLKPLGCLNFFPHLLQAKGRSPECTRKCCFSPLHWENLFSHWSHAYGFSPVCNLKWILCPPCDVNCLPHSKHSNNFFPLVVFSYLTCFFFRQKYLQFRVDDTLNLFKWILMFLKFLRGRFLLSFKVFNSLSLVDVLANEFSKRFSNVFWTKFKLADDTLLSLLFNY